MRLLKNLKKHVLKYVNLVLTKTHTVHFCNYTIDIIQFKANHITFSVDQDQFRFSVSDPFYSKLTHSLSQKYK